jgi:putative mycofactocin binding protein MftB
MTEPGFDLDAPWDLHRQVAVRPEPFGALLYHFGTRRLSFLKDRALLASVQALADHPTARDALLSAGVPERDLRRYHAALATLATSDMLVKRTDAGDTPQ